MCSWLYVNKWKNKEQQTGITYKDIILNRCEVTFTFQRTVGVSLQRREIGPTQVCAFHHTADDTRLTEKISSSVKRNSLFLFISLSLSLSPSLIISLILRLRDSQPGRGCLAWAYRRWMWQNVNVSAWRLKRTVSEVMELFSRRVLKSSLRGEKTMQTVCTLTTNWGHIKMRECTVWSATCLWSENATRSCASLF